MDQFESPTAKDSQFFAAAAQEKAQKKYLFIYFLLLWKKLEQSGGIKFMDGAKQQLEQPSNLTNYYYSPIWR